VTEPARCPEGHENVKAVYSPALGWVIDCWSTCWRGPYRETREQAVEEWNCVCAALDELRRRP
jgi:hypothetical protein